MFTWNSTFIFWNTIQTPKHISLIEKVSVSHIIYIFTISYLAMITQVCLHAADIKRKRLRVTDDFEKRLSLILALSLSLSSSSYSYSLFLVLNSGLFLFLPSKSCNVVFGFFSLSLSRLYAHIFMNYNLVDK
jgi:hypothetical protein